VPPLNCHKRRTYLDPVNVPPTQQYVLFHDHIGKKLRLRRKFTLAKGHLNSPASQPDHRGANRRFSYSDDRRLRCGACAQQTSSDQHIGGAVRSVRPNEVHGHPGPQSEMSQPSKTWMDFAVETTLSASILFRPIPASRGKIDFSPRSYLPPSRVPNPVGWP
jgi:hypothetical protein